MSKPVYEVRLGSRFELHENYVTPHHSDARDKAKEWSDDSSMNRTLIITIYRWEDGFRILESEETVY